MSHQTAEEVKANHIQSMGPELGEIFYFLKQEIFRLFVQWNEYVEAFGTNEKRIQLLNKAAGGFAKSVQDALWSDVLLGLTRVTDPAKTMGKENLSIAQLSTHVSSELFEEVSSLTEDAIKKTAFARDWRNRFLAHRDLLHARDRTARPLKSASRNSVREALDAVVAVMNSVEYHFENSRTIYCEARNQNDVVGLLYVLDDGFLFEEQRKSRVRSGDWSIHDYGSKDL